jgi:hypothetical protein
MKPSGSLALTTALILLGVVPVYGDEVLLRRALSTFFREAQVLRIDAVPDLYEGGYARVSVYVARATLSGGFRVDEAWVRLVGVSFNPRALRAGEFQVDSVRDTAIHMRVSLKNLERYFVELNPWKDIRIWAQDGFLYARGTTLLAGIPARVELKGFFAVANRPELYFYVERLRVNGLAVPAALVRELERRYNPLLTQADWPVRFKLRSVRVTRDEVVISSDPLGGSCTFCGDGGLPAPVP